MTTKALNSRQANWSEYLSRFHFLIRYWLGKNNTLADALSRQKAVVQDQNDVKKVFREQTLLLRECLDPEILKELDEQEHEVIASMDRDLQLMDKLL